MYKNKNIFIRILERFILLMILLVIIQTFLEDFSIYSKFPIHIIKKIKLSAIIFDLIFTIEFIIRMTISISKKKGIQYFFFNNGWIDLISSVPLLILISIPEMLIQVFNINIIEIYIINYLGLTKVIKAIRVIKILRFIRILKIFGKIKNVDSMMTQRHVTFISTVVINSMLIFFISLAILQDNKLLPSRLYNNIIKEKEINNIYKYLYIHGDVNSQNIILNSSFNFSNIYKIVLENKTIYTKNTDDNFNYLKTIHPDFLKTYQVIIPDKLLITYHRENYYQYEAFNNLQNLLLILFVLLIIILFYSRHFSITISNPIFVMRNGFEKKDYTFAVTIKKYYQDDDVFLLGRDYNMKWLPIKLKKLNEINISSTKLTLEDALNDDEK